VDSQGEKTLKEIEKILKSHYEEITVPLTLAYIQFVLGVPVENERDLKMAMEIIKGGNDGTI